MDNRERELTLRIIFAKDMGEAETLEKELKDYLLAKECMEEMS
jgi:hypothetical protein